MQSTDFGKRVAVAAGVGLLVRIAYAAYYASAVGDPTFNGDAFHYHELANLLADGRGFVEPYRALAGETIQAASHPPLFALILAVPSMLGLRSPGAHQAVGLLMGVGSVVVIAHLARHVAGERVGLVAAGLAAVYPPLWINDALVMSETLAVLLCATALLLTYRYLETPTDGGVALIGIAIGLAALSRSENVMLWAFVLVPVVVRAAARDWGAALRPIAIGTAAMVATIAPWTLYNATRFEQPVLLSDQLGVTLLTSNCDSTYHGSLVGFWNLRCAGTESAAETSGADRSVRDAALRREALEYIGDNLSSVPRVMAVRMLRVWSAYDPSAQLRIDSGASSRELKTSQIAFVAFVAAFYLACFGAVLLRLRRVPLFPLVALPAIVTITAALTYGNPRFRAVAEITLVVLAAVALDEGVRRFGVLQRTPARASEAPSDAPSDALAAP